MGHFLIALALLSDRRLTPFPIFVAHTHAKQTRLSIVFAAKPPMPVCRSLDMVSQGVHRREEMTKLDGRQSVCGEVREECRQSINDTVR